MILVSYFLPLSQVYDKFRHVVGRYSGIQITILLQLLPFYTYY